MVERLAVSRVVEKAVYLVCETAVYLVVSMVAHSDYVSAVKMVV